jgi:hypothetical protein
MAGGQGTETGNRQRIHGARIAFGDSSAAPRRLACGYKHREPGSLKQAVAELVARCGGQVRCSELCRVNKSQLHRYTDDSDENQFTHMPVDVVLVLERHCGDAIVTRFLAAEQSAALILLSGAVEPYHLVLSRIGAETGKLFSEGCKNLASGKLPANAGTMRLEALKIMAACSDLLRDLAPRDGP